VQCIGMEMPPDLVPWCAAQVGAPGWYAFGAYDGDALVGMGALFAHGRCGQLSGAATLPEARGRGAQSALMAARIALARDLGLEWVTAETGSETRENPNPSLHNMHRAGLATLYERRNWLLDL
jgi:GNAT superfamily N-acetyltransferase